MRRRIDLKRILVFSLALALSGCGDNLYIAHDTVVGINAAVSTDRQQGQFVLGFDRDFAAIVPVIEPGGTDAMGRTLESREAMSVFGCSRVETESIFLTRYSDVVATGSAALDLAETLGRGDTSTSAKRLATCGEEQDNG